MQTATKRENRIAALDDNGARLKASKPAKAVAKDRMVVAIPDLEIRQLSVRVKGTSSLIMQAMSAKTRDSLDQRAQGGARQKDEATTAKQKYEESLYRLDKPINGCKYYMPGGAFQSAAVNACTSLGRAVTNMKEMLQAFYVVEEKVPIKGEPRFHSAVGRNKMKGACMIYRGEFEEWSATFTVRFNARVVTPAQIFSLFNTAGFAVGVGGWRREKKGVHGMFEVVLG